MCVRNSSSEPLFWQSVTHKSLYRRCDLTDQPDSLSARMKLCTVTGTDLLSLAAAAFSFSAVASNFAFAAAMYFS